MENGIIPTLSILNINNFSFESPSLHHLAFSRLLTFPFYTFPFSDYYTWASETEYLLVLCVKEKQMFGLSEAKKFVLTFDATKL